MPKQPSKKSTLPSINERIKHADGFTRVHLSTKNGCPNPAMAAKAQMIASKKS